MNPDPNYHGFVHTLDPGDDRIEKYKKQLSEQGFDDTELWSLDHTIIRFIYPRLKRFVETYSHYTVTEGNEDYTEMLKALKGIELYYNNLETNIDYDSPIHKEIEEGLASLAKIFRSLWT